MHVHMRRLFFYSLMTSQRNVREPHMRRFTILCFFLITSPPPRGVVIHSAKNVIDIEFTNPQAKKSRR